MKIFLDDIRNSDLRDWVVVRRVDYVKTLLQHGLVSHLSLDHDLGDNEPTGYDLCKWMAENDCWPTDEIYIHSANPVGQQNMKAIVDRYFYERRPE